MQPEAWLDWQYMDEGSDQWCTIRGNFQRHTYRKVKNFYVRQQCTRFIKRGYDIVETSCPQALAAVSPDRDTLVLVLLNEGEETIHNISLDGQKTKNKKQKTRVEAFRTSATEDLASVSDGIVQEGSTLSVTLPQQSITTLIINFTKP